MSTGHNQRWQQLLLRLNQCVLKEDCYTTLSPRVGSRRWCGFPPASGEEITATEQRLGISLPPSYRKFLTTSNGWEPYNNFIKSLLPVQEIGWLRDTNPQDVALIQECYEEDIMPDQDYVDYAHPLHSTALRHRYYPGCLLVGKAWGGRGELLLLNPQVTSNDNEWEAIFFADWLPGNRRYRTFFDLVLSDVENFV